MKRFASVFLSVFLVLSMSACGSKNTPAQSAESQIINEETVSSEITDSETVDTADTVSDSESADDTEEPETMPDTVDINHSSGGNIGSGTVGHAAENNTVGAAEPAEINPPKTQSPVKKPSPAEVQKPTEEDPPETQSPVKKPVPAETQKTAETDPPETQKTVENPAPDPKPPIPVTLSVTQPSDTKPEPAPEPARGKTLIVYFSWSSNTERMANTIKEQTGGDLLELIPATAYPTDYTACTEVALAERDNNARPAIQNLPASIDEYDTILIGYPIWWHTAPMIIGTFLENYDLTGIDVYPFTQSASMDRTQFNNSMEFVRECADGAMVHDGLFARYSDSNSIISYLRNNNLAK